MEVLLRNSLIAWLRADPALAQLNIVAEEAPLSASPPWLGIAASASADWSTKERRGREVRIALELHFRGQAADSAAALVRAVEARIEALPRAQPGFAVAGIAFLRARAEQRPRHMRAVLMEYRFRCLED